MIGAHYFSFVVYRCSPTVNFSGLLRPWPRYVMQFAWIEAIMMFLSLAEGLIEPNNQIQRLVLIFILLIFANPVVSAYFIIKPMFQDIEDSVHYAVNLTVGFIDLVLLLIHTFVEFLTPSILFTLTILFVIIFYLVYSFIMKKRVSKVIVQLYSVYKSSRPILPPLTPVVFSNPLSNQITLSQEAYSVMQAFSSLGIEDEDTFNMFIAVGAKLKVPSIRNIDFIKWGLNYFTSATTLLASSQLIQYFNGCARTETVILQKMREMPSYPNIFKPFIQHLEGLHADIMLDRPILLRSLCIKAEAALSRCKRSIALFWGCVLRRSNSGIREAQCRVRNTISEAEIHFEELMRCYPHTTQAIQLYLSFLLEAKGSFEECNDYLNHLSTYFVARQDELDLDDDTTNDFFTTFLNDETNTFNKYINQLPIFVDHERQAMFCSSSVIQLLFCLAICSVVLLVACFAFILIVLLINISEFPVYISMIRGCSDVTMTLGTAATAARRLCLISSGVLYPNTTISHSTNKTIENVDVVVKTLINASNLMPRLIQDFLVSIAYKNTMVVAMNHWSINLTHHNRPTNMTLSQAMKLIGDSLRNVILLVSKAVNETGPIPQYSFADYSSICQSHDLYHIFKNVKPLFELFDNFIVEFEKMVGEEVEYISHILTLSLEIIPATFFGLFVVLIFISSSIAFKESKFRATLFLSLPEQIASGFFRAECGRPTKKPAGAESIFSVSTQPGKLKTENAKDKIQIIEKLHEFSSVEHKGYNTGLKSYTISIFIFTLLSTISMVVFIYNGLYSSSEFDGKTLSTCFNVIRSVCLEFTTYFIQELFLPDKYRILSDKELFNISESFLEKSLYYHDNIIFGDGTNHNFRDFSAFKELFLSFNDSISNTTNLEKTFMMMHHTSYIKFGFDLKSRLFYLTQKAFIDCFKADNHAYHVNDRYWQEFDHFLIAHLENDLYSASCIYFDEITNEIVNSFYIALSIFIVSFVVLMILYFTFVIPSIIMLKQFFSCGVRLLCQVPHNVFQRSLFINKWLKGQITRSNFMVLETHFNRSISPTLQAKLVKELPESIYIFDLQGNYIKSPSFDASRLEDKTMKSILPLIVDASHDFQLLSVAESAMTKIAEAKDNVQPIIYQAQNVNGVPIRLTFVGISAAEAGIIAKDSVLRQYYSYIAILAKDITQEASQEQQYQQQKERTKLLMKQIIPEILVERVHDGERKISNIPIDGIAILMQICDYSKFVQNIDINLLPYFLQQLHHIVENTVDEYQNVTTISFNSGLLIIATGIFDDELSERVKAYDSVNFASALKNRIEKYAQSVGLTIATKFAIATNQIIYKMQLDISLISFITGDAVQLAHFLLKKAKPNQILVERRTYECIYGQNCDAQHVGEFEYKSSIVTIYSVTVKN